MQKFYFGRDEIMIPVYQVWYIMAWYDAVRDRSQIL